MSNRPRQILLLLGCNRSANCLPDEGGLFPDVSRIASRKISGRWMFWIFDPPPPTLASIITVMRTLVFLFYSESNLHQSFGFSAKIPCFGPSTLDLRQIQFCQVIGKMVKTLRSQALLRCF